MAQAEKTMQMNAEKLSRKLKSPNFKQKLMSAAYADLRLTRLKALPGAMNSGAATPNTKSLFLQIPMAKLPAGQYCQICHEGAGKLFECAVNGKAIRQCKSCKDNTFAHNDALPFSLKFILPPLTSLPVNLIFPLLRFSSGGQIDMDNLRIQYSFIRNWCGIPNRSTHVQWIVDIFAASASGMSLYSDMDWSLSKFPDSKTNKEMLEPISHLLPQIRAAMRMNFDSVTLAVPTMSTSTVKTSNLEQFLFDASHFGIPQKDIFFVMYGTRTDKRTVTFDPICKSGTEILTDIKDFKCIPDGEVAGCKEKWLTDLTFNCFSRVFVSGLSPGRTCGGTWKTFTNKDVNDINNINEL